MTPFYQPSRQAFSSSQNMQQPSFGGGFGGGFQMPQQNFGGFGGGYGFQQPQYGGFGGGFQPQYGGFGGGFQQQGFGFNPMLGGIGGLGFNPMMGAQFGMPMQGFNPYQQHVQFKPQMTAESAADINRAREQRENMQMQNTRSNWSQAAQGATSGMDFLQRLQGLSGGSYVPLSDEQMRLERDARLYSMTPQQRAMAQG